MLTVDIKDLCYCRQCGSLFKRTGRRAKFCSVACREKKRFQEVTQNHITVMGIVNLIKEGREVLFKEIPESVFTEFWNYIEFDSSLIFNDDCTGIISRYKNWLNT